MLIKWKKERQHLLDILDDRNAEILELQRDVDRYRANQESETQRLKEDVYHWVKKYEREHEKRKQLQNDLDTLIKHIDFLENEGK